MHGEVIARSHRVMIRLTADDRKFRLTAGAKFDEDNVDEDSFAQCIAYLVHVVMRDSVNDGFIHLISPY